MKILRCVLIVCISVAIELLLFNFSNIASIIHNNPYLVNLDSELIINSDYDGSNAQWLLNIGDNNRVYNIEIESNENCSPELFYTDKSGKVVRTPFYKINDGYIAKVNETISGYIGVSGCNVELIDKMEINAIAMSFSVARIMAMLLIYYVGKWLFSIQKMPDYDI